MSAAALIALASAGTGSAAQAQDSAASTPTTTAPVVTSIAPSAATPNSGGGSNIRLSIGGNYSSGDYGTADRTQVWSVPVGLRFTSGNFNIRVSVPYVSLNGPGSLIDTPQGRDGGGFDDNGGGRSDNSGRGRGRGGSDNSGSGGSGGGSNSGSGGSGGSGSGGGGSSGGSGGTVVDDSATGGTGGGTGTGTGTTTGRTSGLGDVSVSAGYSLPLTDSLYLDAGVRVKLPTASRARRLGTGELDVTTSLELAYDFAGGSIYAGGRRKFAGTNATSTLRDIWGAGGGASFRLSSGVSVGADYDWSQAASIGGGDISEVTGWMSFRLNRRMRLQVFASTGLTTNSTDFASGATLSYRF